MEEFENLLEASASQAEEISEAPKQLQLERIEKYEAVLDEVLAFLAQEEHSAEEMAAIAEKTAALQAYYTSLTWRKDFHDEEDGLFPNTLKRGVLSEDGIYNALEAYQDLMEELQHSELCSD